MLEWRLKCFLFFLFFFVPLDVRASFNYNGNCNFSCAASASGIYNYSLLPKEAQFTLHSPSNAVETDSDFLKPAVLDGITPSSFDAKQLPPVPSAVFMTLMGFLCISLVKDRKIWLAACVGILCVGQFGIKIIPQLVTFVGTNHNVQGNSSLSKTPYLHPFRNFSRLRIDLENTRYMGLLRHLAGIEVDKRALNRLQYVYPCSQIESTDQFAASMLRYPIPETANCSTSVFRGVIVFSPAFIFNNLARSPPNL